MRDKQSNVAETRVCSSKTMVNAPTNEVNTKAGDERSEEVEAVHLANTVEHLAQGNDSSSNFSLPPSGLIQGVIRDI